MPGPIDVENSWPLGRFHDAGNFTVSVRLKQQHAQLRVLSQPAREYRSGRSRSADNELVVLLQVRRQSNLIPAHTFGKLESADSTQNSRSADRFPENCEQEYQ